MKRLARWTGWCDPCQIERPLVLTERGERGIAAWLCGIGPEDRTLTLTCLVCGEWQEVPHDEADLPEVVESVPARLVAVHPVGVRQVVVETAAYSPYPVVPLPAPRPSTARPSSEPADMTLELVAHGFDLITLAG